MKNIVIVATFLLTMICGNVEAADYQVAPGDTIGIISRKLNCTIEELARLNNIKAPKYIVHIGDIIRYVTDEDIRLAQDWIEEYLWTNVPDQAERISMKMMLYALDHHNIRYDNQRDGGIYADEVLLLADAQEAR